MHSHDGSIGVFEALFIALALTTLFAYMLAARRQRRRGKKWSSWRSLSFFLGVSIAIAALLPLYGNDFHGHMLQHLMLGMIAPLGLVFAAPVTLALRSLPRRAAALLILVLRSMPLHLASRPLVALLLNVGGMYLLYLSPLYQASLDSTLLQTWLHWHFLAAGCLFTWAIAGPDPAPNRPSEVHRLLVVFASMAAHATLAKLMYAYGLPADSPHSLDDIRAAAKLMYYGGDLAELVLVLALMHSWFEKKPIRFYIPRRG